MREQLPARNAALNRETSKDLRARSEPQNEQWLCQFNLPVPQRREPMADEPDDSPRLEVAVTHSPLHFPYATF